MRLSGEVKPNSHVLWKVNLAEHQNTQASQVVPILNEESRITQVTVLKADILDRFRLMLIRGVTEEEALKISQELSLAWDENNAGSLGALRTKKQKVRLLHWDSYQEQKHEQFIDAFEKVQHMYNENTVFKHYVDEQVAQKYKEIKGQIDKKFDYLGATQLLKNEVLEECAVEIVIGNVESYDHQISNQPANSAIKLVREKYPLAHAMTELTYANNETKISSSVGAGNFFQANGGSSGPEQSFALTLGALGLAAIKKTAEEIGVDKDRVSTSFLLAYAKFVLGFEREYRREQLDGDLDEIRVIKPKFIGGLSRRAKSEENLLIELQTVISIGNKNQVGECFEAFVELVNKHSSRISKLKIIVSDWLQRHYLGEEAAGALLEEWVQSSQQYLDKLQIPYEVIGWNKFTNDPAYLEAHEKISTLYSTNSAFGTVVDKCAKQHSHKADFESAKKYILEECAVALLQKGHFAYPSKESNAAMGYVIEKFNPDFHYHGYLLDTMRITREQYEMSKGTTNEPDESRKKQSSFRQ